MVSRSFALFTGLFIILLGLGTIATWVWLSGRHVARQPYVVVTQQSVSGLKPQSPVLFRGISAGRVQSIRLDPNNIRNILVKIQVNQNFPITQGTYATLHLQGFTGLTQLELEDSGEDPTPLPTSPDKPSRIPMWPSLMNQLTDRSQAVIVHVEQLLGQLNILFKEINQAPLQQILTNTETATAQLNEVLETLPALSMDTRQTLLGIDNLVSQLNTLTSSLNELAVKANQLSATGQTAGEKLIHSTFPRINATLEQWTRMTKEMQNLLRTLQENPQSLLMGRQSPPPGPGETAYPD